MILVLGGGPAGRMAAIQAARSGEEVTLVERRSLGGQCLHDGCMQICGLNDIARMIRSAEQAAALGLTNGAPTVNFRKVMDGLSAIQGKIAGILEEETREAGVRVLHGAEGAFRDGKVYINGKETAFDRLIIATGSRPTIPDIPGITLRGVYTPHTLKEMKDLPGKIAIIGGGVMAAEFAYIFSAFGCETHILSRSSLLHQIPDRLRREAMKDLGGIVLHQNAAITAITGDDGVTGISYNGSTLAVDCVLIAAGLSPNTAMIEGVAKGPLGEILVDERFETGVPGIFACGDIIGEPCLTPIARLRGTAAASNGGVSSPDIALAPKSMSLGYEYTWYDSGEEGGTSIHFPGPAGPGTFWSVPDRKTGVASIRVNADDGRILAFAEASPVAGVMGMYLAYLAKEGETVGDLSRLIEVHPTSDGMYSLIKYTAGYLKNR
ncbi:hypothetical protein RJ53_04570 [Methanocalculus chunghsingensis]|uniref:FAD/NAD(P)-binding domain-containing protein n=1 Tax=Methanocalculus chunghsingensis TaxID=156457 RepID=A0A8J7W9T6_9EURY|nr:hypothetical protein [Methanocalculus chunghsingensis]